MSLKHDIETHPAYIKKLREAGGNAIAAEAKATGNAPSVDAGLFDYPEWKPNTEYKKGDLFLYGGQAGFVRQNHTSQSHWIPFTTGTESLYGARPRQRPDGVYPYIYNMKAEVGMKVEDEGIVYECYKPIDPVLYPPSAIPAHFKVVEP